MKQYFILAIMFTLFSCASNKANQPGNSIYWVNSSKVQCSGVGNMQCLKVQKGESINPESWESFHSNIEGFEFEPGYIYKLIVHEEKLKKEDVPADASSIKYTLVKVLEKKQDIRLQINDIWILTSLEGEEIQPSQKGKTPRVEFNVAKMKVMGNDGCNNFTGSIKKLDGEAIQFGPLAGTRKFCPDMAVPDKFNVMLNKATGYKIKNMHLTLFDVSGKELMSFKKID